MLRLIITILLLLQSVYLLSQNDKDSTNVLQENNRIKAIKLDINIFLNKVPVFFGENIGLYSKRLFYPSYDFLIENKKEDFHTIGINFLGKPLKVYSKSENSWLGANTSVQLKYQYDINLLKHSKTKIKPFLGLNIRPSYQKFKAKRSYPGFAGGMFYGEQDYLIESYFLMSQLCPGVTIRDENHFFFIGIRMNLFILSFDKYYYRTYDVIFGTDPLCEKKSETNKNSTNLLWIKNFVEKKFLFETVYFSITLNI